MSTSKYFKEKCPLCGGVLKKRTLPAHGFKGPKMQSKECTSCTYRVIT